MNSARHTRNVFIVEVFYAKAQTAVNAISERACISDRGSAGGGTGHGAPCEMALPSSNGAPNRCCRSDQATSNRSRFMTLSHAATKSLTNFFCESLHA